MKIRVVKCAKDTFWYSTHKGETFEVIDATTYPDAYKVWKDKKCEASGYVFKFDAELVDEKQLTDVDKMIAFLEWLQEHGMLSVEKMDALAIVKLYNETRIAEAVSNLMKHVASNSKS